MKTTPQDVVHHLTAIMHIIEDIYQQNPAQTHDDLLRELDTGLRECEICIRSTEHDLTYKYYTLLTELHDTTLPRVLSLTRRVILEGDNTLRADMLLNALSGAICMERDVGVRRRPQPKAWEGLRHYYDSLDRMETPPGPDYPRPYVPVQQRYRTLVPTSEHVQGAALWFVNVLNAVIGVLDELYSVSTQHGVDAAAYRTRVEALGECFREFSARPLLLGVDSPDLVRLHGFMLRAMDALRVLVVRNRDFRPRVLVFLTLAKMKDVAYAVHDGSACDPGSLALVADDVRYLENYVAR